MISKLVHNTMFRGACKFKDLDHFLGKKKSVASYFLKTSEDLKESRMYKKIEKSIKKK